MEKQPDFFRILLRKNQKSVILKMRFYSISKVVVMKKLLAFEVSSYPF